MMPKLMLVFTLACLAAISANPAISGTPPPPPKSVAEICEENFETSSANSTCWNEGFREANDGECRIAANCRQSEFMNVFSTITLDPANAGSVVNCNGRLKLSC